jgi:hypothetical protein
MRHPVRMYACVYVRMCIYIYKASFLLCHSALFRLLLNFMGHSFWEADSVSTGQSFLPYSQQLTVGRILSQLNDVHTRAICFFYQTF